MSSSAAAGLPCRTAMASAATITPAARAGAARGGPGGRRAAPTPSSSTPIAASCTPTATGCSGSVHDAEDALQEALLRAWRGIAKFEGRSSLRSWLYRIATNTSLNAIEKRPKRVLPIDYGPAADPHERPGRAAGRVGLDRALCRRAARARGRARRARGPLRAARGRRARVHRRAPASAAEPARGADPARGARVLRQGGRRDARDDDRLDQQRPAAGPGDGRRAAARAEPAGRRCARSATSACARSSTPTSTPGSAATSTRWSGC